MVKQTFAFTNFTAGKLSPRLDGRTDLGKYYNGCKQLKNFTIQPHGGASRRPGTRFIHETKSSANKVRLIPFEFSTTQTYVMEFGNEYIRFYKDKGIITEADKTISAITKANPAVVTANSHGYTNGDHVIITAVVGMTEVNNKTFIVADSTTNTFSLKNVDGVAINSSAFTTYGSAGAANKIYEVASPYQTADLPTIKFAQSADLMYLVHPNYAIRKLSRSGHTNWSLTAPSLVTSENKTVSAVTKANPGVVTTSADHGLSEGNFVTFTNIGGMTQLNGNVFKVGTVNSSTAFNLQDSSGTDLNTSGYGTFSAGGSDTVNKLTDPVLNTTTDYFPSSVTFFEQRLVFAGSNNDPQTLWFSKTSDYLNFTTGSNDSDAMVYTIASNKVNAIRYLSAQRSLIAGTIGGEFVVSASGTTSPLTPTNVQIQKQTSYGSANVDAVQIANVTMFLQRAKRKLREMAYAYDFDTYVAPDMTILSEDITKSGITEMVYQQEPDSILWCTRTDGALIGLTYQRNEEVVGWHEHQISGKLDSSKNIIVQAIEFTSNATNVSTANNTITKSSHGLSTGDVVYYYALSNTIGGLSNGIPYYAIATNSNTIKLAISAANATAGTAVSLTSAPSSDTTQYLYQGVNIANNTIFSLSHGFENNDEIYYDTSGTAIGGLSENTKFYVKRINQNEFKLSTTSDLKNILELTSAPTSEQTDNIFINANVENIATIPGDSDEDDLYIVVKRTINGATRRYVEYLTSYDYGETIDNAFFVDSGLSYSDTTPTTIITGLDHLEGEQVTILADGSTHSNKQVSSGSITLDRSANTIQIGLGYESILQTMRIEAGAQQGVAQSRIKRIHEITLRLFRSVGLEVGSNLSDMEIIPFRTTSDTMDVATLEFSGDKRIEFRGDFDTDGHIFIRQSQPLPTNVIGIYPRVTTNEG